jgi:hypothetical protein
LKIGQNIDSYKRFYIDLNFDRSGLFETVKRKYSCQNALYPGCSIHITPSFYFQHVVYIDISEIAQDFFKNIEEVKEFINDNKTYKQSTFIQFLNRDYTKELPIRENSYDLLIALYAGEITQSCKKYVKPGGIILTNNHQNDAVEVLKDTSLFLDALIYKKGKKYVLEEKPEKNFEDILRKYNRQAKNMKKTDRGLEYVDKQCYFVLKKLGKPSCS